MLPNFLIIGAAKSGTTSLSHYLNQHEQIFMSPMKEPYFFALEGQKLDFRGPGDKDAINKKAITNLDSYCSLFAQVSKEKAIGEASTLYLYDAKAPERIKHYIPDVRLIAILRNPVERAYSHYLHFLRDGREPILDFSQAIKEEKKRMKLNWAWSWHYVNVGYYSVQLSRYYERFDRNQIKVFLFEEFNTTPLKVINDLYRFLEVESDFTPDISQKYNASGIPKNKTLHLLLTKNSRFKNIIKKYIPEGWLQLGRNFRDNNLYKPPLSEDLRDYLLEIYCEDILRTQDIIQKDLSKWLRSE